MSNFDMELIKKYLPKSEWEKAINKLATGYPVQYILGNVEFYNSVFEVNENVLIPRFETEYLVDDLLKLIKDYSFINPAVIDIGTGSGCIAISIKKNIECHVDALDISSKALEVAKRNAENNNVDINFIEADIMNYTFTNKYDILVSNPPYVSDGVSVDSKTKYEPQIAIFAKEEGLIFYKEILEKSRNYLNSRNIIAFEIGHNQSDEIASLTKKYYPNAKIIAKNDLNDYNRYFYIIND